MIAFWSDGFCVKFDFKKSGVALSYDALSP